MARSLTDEVAEVYERILTQHPEMTAAEFEVSHGAMTRAEHPDCRTEHTLANALPMRWLAGSLRSLYLMAFYAYG